MTVTCQEIAPVRRPRQFTLRGLLSFVVAWSAYFSMLGTAWPGLRLLDDAYRDRPLWPLAAAVLGTWVVLCLVYRRWKLRQALTVHYSGPIMTTGLVAVFGGIGLLADLLRCGLREFPLEGLLLVPFWAVVYGCGISALVSFPASMLMLLHLFNRES